MALKKCSPDGEKFRDPNELVSEAQESLMAFQQVQAIQQDKSLEPNVEVPEISVGKWSPPPVGFLKINWDAALEAKQGTVGLGLVA